MFCSICASVLPAPSPDELRCRACGSLAPMPDRGVSRTASTAGGDVAALRSKLGIASSGVDATVHAEVDADCNKCGHGRATFTTVQLRSVDEGSTVFYTCCACKFKWSTNN